MKSATILLLTTLTTVLFSVVACKTTLPDSSYETKKTISVGQTNRQNLIRSMELWQDVDTQSLDLLKGPQNDYSFAETISCTFKEPEKDDFGSGLNSKFNCIDNTTGKTLKIKYGIRNGEVYGEIAFSRLMYALGFYHDHNFSVRVECYDCPKDPWRYIQEGGSPRPGAKDLQNIRNMPNPIIGKQVFVPALVEIKMKGNKVENVEDQGISWKEFNDFSGLSKKQQVIRDAYVLLMGFVQHVDSKPDQQRLSCYEAGTIKTNDGFQCDKARFLVHDGGWTFGAGFTTRAPDFRPKMELSFWEENPVFKNKDTCKIGVKRLLNSDFKNKEISEDGREFLAQLLNRLSRNQIKDIFRASRVDFRDQVLHNADSETTLEKWVDVFVKKRQEISSTRCPKKL